jgi:hypothetical protein
VSWDAAPNCTADASKAETKVVYDSLGRPWGFEDNRSCAFRCGRTIDCWSVAWGRAWRCGVGASGLLDQASRLLDHSWRGGRPGPPSWGASLAL